MARKQFRRQTNRTDSKKTLHLLSLMIAAVALTVIVSFFLPWVEAENDLSGLDVASSNVNITEDFPSGVVFILPLVAASLLFQYYRRVTDLERPRRRFTTALMLLIGVVATLIWIRAYTLNYVELRNQIPEPSLEVLPTDPSAPSATPPTSDRKEYTTNDALQEQFTIELWLHLFLGMALLFIPFLDDRTPAPPPEI